MLFGQAIDALKQGKPVKRSGEDSLDAITLEKPWNIERGYLPRLVTVEGEEASLEDEDFFASDWEVA